VDQAVALDYPDFDARRRLFGLYRGGLDVDESRLDSVLERTEGVTASFLKDPEPRTPSPSPPTSWTPLWTS
jgi:hypothetical protein